MYSAPVSSLTIYSVIRPELFRASAAAVASSVVSKGPRYTLYLKPTPLISSNLWKEGTPWARSRSASAIAEAWLLTLMTWTTMALAMASPGETAKKAKETRTTRTGQAVILKKLVLTKAPNWVKRKLSRQATFSP
jgi:hypothetical protein